MTVTVYHRLETPIYVREAQKKGNSGLVFGLYFFRANPKIRKVSETGMSRWR